jgi:hypothetical protein
MSASRRRLGQRLATSTGQRTTGRTVTAEVADVTETGVNLYYPGGTLLLNVPCSSGYPAASRKAGDWVTVRSGPRPVVLWKRDSQDPDEAVTDLKTLAAEAASELQQVRAATYGTGAPAGSGWQTASAVYVRTVNDKLELYFQVGSGTGSPTAPDAGAPAPVTVSPNSYGTWRGGRPDDYADYPTQGDWTGRGNRRGGWFYGTKIADACSGKTVASMKVAFTRRTGSGHNAKRPMHLYLHDHTSPPSGQLDLDAGPEELLSLSVGGKGTATLPSSWRSQLASGAARGLAIYYDGSNDYMSVSGGKITITFSA